MTFAPGSRRNPNAVPRDLTLHDDAIALVGEEVRRRSLEVPGQGLLDPYGVGDGLRAGQVSIRCARSPERVRVPRTPSAVEAALGVLVSRGLVDELVLEGLVSGARPQRYRWSRAATVETLRRFCAGSVPRISGPVCSAPGCQRSAAAAGLYCSAKCAQVVYLARSRAKKTAAARAARASVRQEA